MKNNDLDSWNENKKELNNLNKKVLFKEGEVWWCSFGLNIGNETYGKGDYFRRPAIVFRKLSSEDCIVIPLSTKGKIGSWYFSFKLEGVLQTAMLHQKRMVSTKRFGRRFSVIPEPDFEELRKAVKVFYGFS